MASSKDIDFCADVTKLEIINENAVEVIDQYAPGASFGDIRTRTTS